MAREYFHAYHSHLEAMKSLNDADEVEFLSPKEHEVLDVATMEDYKGGDDLPF